MSEKIQSLRARIDELNLSLLQLLSDRATIASEIGSEQSALGMSQYDPAREQQMLEALVAANTGPFDAGTAKSVLKQIFLASMQVGQLEEKRSYLTSRGSKTHDSVVDVAGVKIGKGQPPVLIAGPCAIESREQVSAVARHVASRGVKLFRGGAYKPRTDPYSFQGLGQEGLRLAREACDEHGLAFVSELVSSVDLPLFEDR